MSSTPKRFTAHIPRRAPVSRRSFVFDIKPFDFIHLSIAPQFPTGFPNYEIHERYSPQPSFPYSSSRSTTPNITGPTDPRKLPPLSTSPGPQVDRWQQPSYLPQSNGFSGANSIRSPTASYPPAYIAYSSANLPYSYHIQQSHDHLSLMNTQAHGPMFDDLSHLDLRSTLPCGRSCGSSHATHILPRNYSPPPVSRPSPEEPTFKKTRKCADAAQLKVLDETYSLTAFPSTDVERATWIPPQGSSNRHALMLDEVDV